MAKLRVQPFEDMGYPAILLNMDQGGIKMFDSAVRQAHDNGVAVFEFDGIVHRIVREDGAADVEIDARKVIWRFDDAALAEVIDLMVLMVSIDKPGHQYVDLKSPVGTLVLSHNEYGDRLAYGEFSQLYPTHAAPDV